MDDANCFHMIRLELKTSVNHMNVTVVSTVTGCDVTTVQQHYMGSTRLLTCVNRSTRPIHHTRIQRLAQLLVATASFAR